jgi:hypothetical protein
VTKLLKGTVRITRETWIVFRDGRLRSIATRGEREQALNDAASFLREPVSLCTDWEQIFTLSAAEICLARHD